MAFTWVPRGTILPLKSGTRELVATGAGSHHESVGFSSYFFGRNGSTYRNPDVLGNASDERCPMGL